MIVAVTCALLAFTAVKEPISPVPVAVRPMLVRSFVQEYVVVPTVLVVANKTAAVFVLLHTTWLPG